MVVKIEEEQLARYLYETTSVANSRDSWETIPRGVQESYCLQARKIMERLAQDQEDDTK